MKQSLIMVCASLVFAGGCGRHDWSMEAPKKPAPPPEMKLLEKMVGTWEGTATMLEPSPEAMKEHMPEGAPDMPNEFKGGGKTEWVMGGMYLKSDGWHEMGDGLKAQYVEYIGWDAKAGKYRTCFFSDWGEQGTGLMTANDDGKSFRVKTQGSDAEGRTKRGEGTMTITDDNTIDWTWTEKGPMGTMKLKGTSKRKM